MKKHREYYWLIILAGIIIIAPIGAIANTINIPDDFETIQAGIDASEDGDTVLVSPGQYEENIIISALSVVLASLYLTTGDSLYADSTIIQPPNSGSVVHIQGGERASVVAGFTIRNGTGTHHIDEFQHSELVGGGIFLETGSANIDHCVIKNNILEADHIYLRGSGIYVQSTADVSIQGCRISDNLLRSNNIDRNCFGGGINVTEGQCSISNCIINNNSCDGIFCFRNELIIRGCQIQSNDCCGLKASCSHLQVWNSTIESNLIGIYSSLSEEGSFIDSCFISGNTGDRWSAGGVYLDDGFMDVKNTTISHNHEGGFEARYITGSIDNCQIINNRGFQGGGIGLYSCRDGFEIVDSNVSGNGAEYFRFGGGLYSTSSNITILRSVFTGNFAGTSGGIWIDGGQTKIINSTIAFNTSATPRQIGAEDADIVILNSILWDNGNSYVIVHESDNDPNSLTVVNSCIRNGIDGVEMVNEGGLVWMAGNIQRNPYFMSDNVNLRLRLGSPCIDAGRSFFVLLGDTLINMSREDYVGLAPDMGAYESSYNDVPDEGEFQPIQFSLFTPFPNPFNSFTTIGYSLPVVANVSLAIYDLSGREVTRLVDGTQPAGMHEAVWSADDEASGVYVVALDAGGLRLREKVALVR